MILEEIELDLDCEKKDAVKCQRLVEDKIQKKLRPFILQKLMMAHEAFLAYKAENERIIKKLFDKASQDEIALLKYQKKQYEENEAKYIRKIEEQ